MPEKYLDRVKTLRKEKKNLHLALTTKYANISSNAKIQTNPTFGTLFKVLILPKVFRCEHFILAPNITFKLSIFGTHILDH